MNSKKNKISATVEINSIAQMRLREGLPVYNLSAGEPIMDIFPPVANAAIAAIEQSKTLYPPVAGIPELRSKASEWLNATYNTRFKPENILVTNGGKLGLYLTIQALINAGDAVIIPSPFWVSYPTIVQLFSGKEKIIKTTLKNGWKITPPQLRKACDKKTKILILNNACNPTGALYDKEELLGILEVAQEKNLTVISDEVYSGLVFDGNEFVSCASFPEYADRVIVIQSCSKNFGMTGWRVGFVCADPKIISAVTNLLSQATSGVTTISQWAALEAFNNASEITVKIKDEIQSRRNLLIKGLENSFSITLAKPQSSLYLFLSLKDIGIAEKNSAAFCKSLLQQTGVTLVPGSAFGQEGFVRLSYGARPEIIRKAIKILKDFIQT